MLRILSNGVSAMNAQQEKLDSISNNLANVSTAGYKREDVKFQDLVYETLNRTGYPSNGDNPKEPLNGTGVKASGWVRDKGQGSLKSTNIKSDLAIDGQGFFRVTMGDGTKAYERSGNFSVDGNGDLVDKSGNRLDIEFTQEGANLFNSGVVFNKDNFTVKESGEVYITYPSEDSGTQTAYYGKINLYDAVGDDSLTSIGQNLYQPKPGVQMNVVRDASIYQGFEENSNVDLGQEMTNLIIAQRAFELGSRAMKTGDEMWGLINSLKGR